ncbi:hypothetical protein [Allochromatium vinosum]|uniref:hypothetical protein n=1 Tax=Allochromatium vinosum TaxID=1049 RepID=UPI0019050AC4|nr:hypothetical protein [Allochromatium vinosum]
MNWTAILLLAFSSSAYAIEVTSPAELIGLPAYCRCTLLIRDISHDPTPCSMYEKFGPTFGHLHHYCWALNTENHVTRENPSDGQFWLRTAIGDIDYVIKQNRDPNFILLPEIYTSKARILFKLDQPSDAIQ